MRDISIRLILSLATVLSVGAQTLDLGATPVPGAATEATVPAATPIPSTRAPVDDGWSGCVDPSKPEELIKIGKKTTICIVLGSSTNWNVLTPATQYLRLSFQPQADEYSRFHVPSSFSDLVIARATTVHDGSNNVTFHVASQKVLSFQRVFYTPTAGGKVYPYLTAIVDVQKGVVKGITWDDACLFCSKGKCEENTYDFNGNLGTQKEYGQPTKGCYIEQPECTAAAAAAAADDAKPICDISVYVVWTGDDADGKALQSSAFRFSAFPEQEIQNRITDNLPDIPSGLLNLVGQGDNDAENGA